MPCGGRQSVVPAIKRAYHAQHTTGWLRGAASHCPGQAASQDLRAEISHTLGQNQPYARDTGRRSRRSSYDRRVCTSKAVPAATMASVVTASQR